MNAMKVINPPDFRKLQNERKTIFTIAPATLVIDKGKAIPLYDLGVGSTTFTDSRTVREKTVSATIEHEFKIDNTTRYIDGTPVRVFAGHTIGNDTLTLTLRLVSVIDIANGNIATNIGLSLTGISQEDAEDTIATFDRINDIVEDIERTVVNYVIYASR